MHTLETLAGVQQLEGDYTVTTIQNGAVVTIKNGGLVVEENVENDVKITINDTRSNITVDGITYLGTQSTHGSVIHGAVIMRGGSITINGKRVLPHSLEQASSSGKEDNLKIVGVKINGSVGDNVTIDSDRGIEILHNTGTDFECTTSSGTITLQDCGENATIEASSGDVNIRNITASTVDVSSGTIALNKMLKSTVTASSGNISVQQAINSTVKVSSGNVNVTLSQNTKLKASSGNIRARELDEKSTAKTSSGNITIQKAHKNTVAKSTCGTVFVNGERVPTRDRVNTQVNYGSFVNFF